MSEQEKLIAEHPTREEIARVIRDHVGGSMMMLPSQAATAAAAIQALYATVLEGAVGERRPVDMVLFCPACGLQHIDEPEPSLGPRFRDPGTHDEWTNPPHRSHLCHGCGHIWRPADIATNGVAAIKTKGKHDSALSVREEGEKGASSASLPAHGAPQGSAPATDAQYSAGKWSLADVGVVPHGTPQEMLDRAAAGADQRKSEGEA